jgi:hypothetical protein
LVPQHDQRKPKNNPKNGAAYVVHGKGDSEEEEDGRWLDNTVGVEQKAMKGTGSCPP